MISTHLREGYLAAHPFRQLSLQKRLAEKTTTSTTVLRPVVRDYPGEPVVPEETLTHPGTHHPEKTQQSRENPNIK